jgi:hypothetical protein
MKVSIIHAERGSSPQYVWLDVVTPECSRSDPPMPPRLLPGERYTFTLRRGDLLAFVASVRARAGAPLVFQLEAEAGESIDERTVRSFQLDPPPAYYTFKALDVLKRIPLSLTVAGDRKQFAIVKAEISPERDQLFALTLPHLADDLGDNLSAVLEDAGQVSAEALS